MGTQGTSRRPRCGYPSAPGHIAPPRYRYVLSRDQRSTVAQRALVVLDRSATRHGGRIRAAVRLRIPCVQHEAEQVHPHPQHHGRRPSLAVRHGTDIGGRTGAQGGTIALRAAARLWCRWGLMVARCNRQIEKYFTIYFEAVGTDSVATALQHHLRCYRSAPHVVQRAVPISHLAQRPAPQRTSAHSTQAILQI